MFRVEIITIIKNGQNVFVVTIEFLIRHYKLRKCKRYLKYILSMYYLNIITQA